MNNPSAKILAEFDKISKTLAVPASLNWCEKRMAWGVLVYEFSIGSYWIAFMTIDRFRK